MKTYKRNPSDPPAFWKNISKGTMLFFSASGIACILFGLISLYMFFSGFQGWGARLAVCGGASIIIGMIFLIFTVFSLKEKEQAWGMYLPPNRELFKILNKRILETLDKAKYEYEDEGGLGYSRLIRIDLSPAPELKLNFTIFSGSLVNEFRLMISNIRIENADQAHTLAEILTKVLESIDYKKYPSNFKMNA